MVHCFGLLADCFGPASHTLGFVVVVLAIIISGVWCQLLCLVWGCDLCVLVWNATFLWLTDVSSTSTSIAPFVVNFPPLLSRVIP